MGQNARMWFVIVVLAALGVAGPVQAQSAATVSPNRTELVFAVRGTAVTPAQAVRLEHTTPGASVAWRASATVPWLVLSQTAGTSPARFNVSLADAAAIPIGESTGEIHITLDGSSDVRRIQVSVSRLAERGTPPGGHMDAPPHGYAVPGPVVLQGWAIDDVYVSSVQIVAGAERRVLATATFVDGGRPDIEAIRPKVPFQTRSVWSAVVDPAVMAPPRGSMIVTAVATDAEGQTTDLATRLVTFLPAPPADTAPDWLYPGAAGAAVVLLGIMLWAIGRSRTSASSAIVTSPPTRLVEVAAMIALVLVFVLLWPGWMPRSLDYDEVYTASRFVVGVPFLTAATGVEVFNNHPGFSVLAWMATRLLGSAEWVVRLPALLMGVCAVVVTWRLSRRWMSPAFAVAAAGLLVASPLFGVWSRSARGYSGVAALTCLSLLLWLRTKESGRARDAVAHAVVTALAVYLHLYGIWMLAAQCLALLVWWRRSDGATRGWYAAAASSAGAALLVMAAYLPLVPGLLQVAEGRGRGEWTMAFGAELVRAFGGTEVIVALVAIALLAIIGAVAVFRREPAAAVVLIAALVLPLVVMWMILRPLDLQPRFFVFWVPCLAVLLAASLSFLWRWRIAGAAATVLTAWLMVIWLQAAVVPAPVGGNRDVFAGLAPRTAPALGLGADVMMYEYYAGPMRQVHSFAEIEQARASSQDVTVIYHDVAWNAAATIAAADQLTRQCSTDRRGAVVIFTCR